MSRHPTTISSGSDFRNYVVRCKCGWAHAGTYMACTRRANEHIAEDNRLKWNDTRRAKEPDWNPNWAAPR